MSKLVLVKPEYFKETGNVITTDRHNKPNCILLPVCGKIPSKAMVLAGSVAIAAGLMTEEGQFIGKMALVQVREDAPDKEYGRQFSVTCLDPEVSPKDIFTYTKELGEGGVDEVKEVEAKKEEIEKPTTNTSNVGNKPEVKVGP